MKLQGPIFFGLARLIVLQLGPENGVFFWPTLSAIESATRFDLKLTGHFNKPRLRDSVLNPFVNAWRLNAKHASDRGNSSERLDDFRVCHVVHGRDC